MMLTNQLIVSMRLRQLQVQNWPATVTALLCMQGRAFKSSPPATSIFAATYRVQGKAASMAGTGGNLLLDLGRKEPPHLRESSPVQLAGLGIAVLHIQCLKSRSRGTYDLSDFRYSALWLYNMHVAQLGSKYGV